MSAHSFPSLISDSSSLSRSSDLHDLTHERLSLASLVTKPTASIPLPPRSPESSEFRHLRSTVSRLEQDKLVLGDYAAELQPRIRRLELKRMEQHDPLTDREELEFVSQAENSVDVVVPRSLSRPNSITSNPCSIPPQRSPFYRPSTSLSTATSPVAKRALASSSPHGTPSLTSTQPAFPVSIKGKLVPKRTLRAEVPKFAASPDLQSSIGRSHCEYEFMTPTRRRLQAMYGMFSSESSPSLGDGAPTQRGLNDYELNNDAQPARAMRVPYFKGSNREKGREETKRPTFTSKLDSIILTSKLFPLTSRGKTSLTPASADPQAPTSHTAVIPLARSTSATPHTGRGFIDSPPKNVKDHPPRKGHSLLSQSLGLEENQHSNLNSKPTDRKLIPRPPGRVSFSDRLLSSSDRGDEIESDVEHTGRAWGSWSRMRRSAPLSFIKEKPTPSPPSTPRLAFSSCFSRSHGEQSGDAEVQRRGKRSSLTPGCLKTLVSGSNDRNKAPLEGQRDRRALHRSHSETRRSSSESQAPLRHVPLGGLRRSEDIDPDANVRGKDDKKRITPSRVGSPMPKSRLPELQGGEPERTCSMRSAGKWGHRGRGFSAELTRRRTIHPMFSFERPGSTEAASMTSSRRGGKTNEEEASDVHRTTDKSKRLRRAATSASSETPGLQRHESDASASQTTHTQDHSHASGNTGCAGFTRPEPGLTGRMPMMRTRLGLQTHGTFAFEPAAAVVCSPRSTLSVGRDHVHGMSSSGGSLSKRRGAGLVRSLSVSETHAKGQSDSSKPEGQAVDKATKELEYLKFCDELKVVLGNGEDWSTFKKYVRRFDLEVLSEEVLLQRVKKLLDGRRSVDGATRLRLYERFVKIVHDISNE